MRLSAQKKNILILFLFDDSITYYYPAVLVIVLKMHKMSTNIPWYLYSRKLVWLVDMLTLPRAFHIQICHTFSVVYNSLAKNMVWKSWIINSLLGDLVSSIVGDFY